MIIDGSVWSDDGLECKARKIGQRIHFTLENTYVLHLVPTNTCVLCVSLSCPHVAPLSI